MPIAAPLIPVLHLLPLLFIFFLPQSQARSLYLLPSFQGTLLHNDGIHIHLAPLTPATYQGTYSLLTDPATATTAFTEYPIATCAPSSHAGHCKPLPAEGSIAKLRAKYNVSTIPYDWRLPSSSLAPTLTSTFTNLPKGSILLAHGTACRLATIINPRNVKLVCLSPVQPPLAKQAIVTGDGLLTLGDAHRYKHPAHTPIQKDFRMMEHELGLVSKRRLLPESAGPSDDHDIFAAPQSLRVELATKLRSIAEYAEGGALGVDDSSVCVQGSGVGDGCDGFVGRVLQVDIPFFDLVGLVEAAVKSSGAGDVQLGASL